MGKVVLTAILFVGSLVSAGALELQGIAPSVGRGIVTLARDDGRYGNSPLKSWFDHLASGKGMCCSFADGFRVGPTSIGIRRTATIACGSRANGSSYLTMQW
jgi:hypothetical protein